MIKLGNILSELLDTSTAETYQLLTPGAKATGEGDMEPKVSKHSFSDGTREAEYFWAFKNAKGNKMDITLTLQSESDGKKPILTLSFGKVSGSGDKYHSTTGAGDLKTILATVIKAADAVIAKENIDGRNGLYAISYAPSDDRRDRIYRYFISTYFPNFEMKKEGVVYQMFINKNYKA